MHTTLPTAEEAQQQVAPQLWNPALASMCLLVQSAALVPDGISIVRHTWAALSICRRRSATLEPSARKYVSACAVSSTRSN